MNGPAELLGVIGVLRDELGRILLVQRAAQVSHPGLWCFPGGHVEPGESLACAVERELLEELSLCVRAERHLGFVRVPSTSYRLEVFAVRLVSGILRPEPSEVASASWMTVDEIRIIGSPMASNLGVLALIEE